MAEYDDVDAPGLREVAQVWWDVDRVPVVRWLDDGRTYVLVDPEDETNELTLALLAEPPTDPRVLASVLAEGLASCDFPPSGTRAAPGRVAATLRVAGLPDVLADDA